MNDTITNQCASPMPLHLSMRVWPSVSRSMVAVRWPLPAKRAGSTGCPSRMTRTIWRTARTASTTAVIVTRAATSVATTWTGPIACASVSPAWLI
jgi:hypothetical protein